MKVTNGIVIVTCMILLWLALMGGGLWFLSLVVRALLKYLG